MSPLGVLVALAVFVRGVGRVRREPRRAAPESAIDGAADGVMILAHLQERAAGYRFYVQISEQKAGFLFVAWTGLLTFAVGRLDLFRSARATVQLLYVFAVLSLGLACVAALATVVESEFLFGRARAGRLARRPKSLAVVYAPLYHNHILDSPSGFVVASIEGTTRRDLAVAVAGELQQLARMHEQRRRTLPASIWLGVGGSLLFYLAVTFRTGLQNRASRPNPGAPASNVARQPAPPAFSRPAGHSDLRGDRDSGSAGPATRARSSHVPSDIAR